MIEYFKFKLLLTVLLKPELAQLVERQFAWNRRREVQYFHQAPWELEAAGAAPAFRT